MYIMSKKYLLTLSACSLLAISACSQMSSNDSQAIANADGVKAETSEDILAAQGSWNIVEEQAADAPMDLHSSAKKKVNPNNRTKKQFVPEEQLANVAGTHGEEDMRYRLLRMEREVAELRGDFDKLLPPLSNLIVADKELDTTIHGIMAKPERKPDVTASKQEMQEMAKRVAEAPAPAPALAPVTKTVETKVETTQYAAAADGHTEVKNIRFGEHPGKTRMVLDLTGASKYRADVDNGEKLLLLELSDADWAAASQKILKHPLVAGYTAQPAANGGTTLALELKKPVKIVGSAALPPNKSSGHRIYLDLAAG